MNITTTVDGTTLHVQAGGRFDSTTADEFMEAVQTQLSSQITDLVIDMQQVDFISSKGVRILVMLFKQMGSGHICVQNPNPPVREVLRMTNLSKQFGLD